MMIQMRWMSGCESFRIRLPLLDWLWLHLINIQTFGGATRAVEGCIRAFRFERPDEYGPDYIFTVKFRPFTNSREPKQATSQTHGGRRNRR